MNTFSNKTENIILTHLREFPFHNLTQLTNTHSSFGDTFGGTCFDHAILLRDRLRTYGYSAFLHEAIVCCTGKLTHRLVRINKNQKNYFLDAGSGWPTHYILSTSPPNTEINCSGIKFKFQNHRSHLIVLRYNGTEWLEMNKIQKSPMDEVEILQKFKQRYKFPLPYSNELRICWLTDKRFFRIADKTLYIFEKYNPVIKNKLSLQEIAILIHDKFPSLTPKLTQYIMRQK